MEKYILNNGVEMPMVGFGVFQVTDLNQCEEAVLKALNAGYRLIDTAAVYKNEEAVGRAIKRSGVPREEIFVTTKLWISDATEEKAGSALETSLKKLGLDYVDLYLIHQPYNDIFGSWRAMEKAYKEGKTRAIGVSNFYEDQVSNLVEYNEIVPAVNQIEVNPFYQQEEKHKYMQGKGILTQSWASFAEGKNNIFTNEVLVEIAKKYNKSVAQVILRWLNQREIAVIPKSVTESRIIENREIFDFQLDNEDIERIKRLDTGKSLFVNHRNPENIVRLKNLYV